MCPPAHPLEMRAVGSHVSRDELYHRLSQQASPNSATFNYSNLFALFFPEKDLGASLGQSTQCWDVRTALWMPDTDMTSYLEKFQYFSGYQAIRR